MEANSPYPHLFSTGRIGTLDLPNRIVMAPMESNLAGPDGTVSDDILAYYRARAQGGVGMVIVEYACVDRPLGLGGAPQLAIDDDGLIASHARLASAIKEAGARACLQLFHAGRQPLRKYTDGRQSVAASAIACKVYREEPRELAPDEIALIVARFGAAARRAIAAGYDAVEIHAAHGYLLGGFLSAASNRRTDLYGGSLENRIRFPSAVIAAVKAGAGHAPVIVRFSAEEFVEGGTVLDEARWLAPRFVEAGADALHVSTGTAERMDCNVDPVSSPQAWRVPLAAAIRPLVSVPVITVGVLREPEVAERAVADGSADFVALGRALLADPEWPAKAARGAPDEIRPCTSCNWCVDQLLQGQRIGCAENPLAGRETEKRPRRLESAGRAAVIGGGPGGIAAGLLLDAAGYRVTMFERDRRLAPGLLASAAPPDKDKFRWYRDYLLRRLARSGIEVRLGQHAAPEDVAALQPDVAIVSTGAVDRRLDVPGIGAPHVAHAYDVLAGIQPLGDGPVVVYGAGETGCEAAEYAAEAGAEVTLVARSPGRRLARRAQYVYRRRLLERLEAHSRITIETGCELVSVAADHVVLRREANLLSLPARRVLLAAGRLPDTGMAEELEGCGIRTFAIGDGREVRRIGDAVHDAYRTVTLLTRDMPDSQEMTRLPI